MTTRISLAQTTNFKVNLFGCTHRLIGVYEAYGCIFDITKR